MTKGIVGIQNIFGIGGAGQPTMINIDMYKKANETVASFITLQFGGDYDDIISDIVKVGDYYFASVFTKSRYFMGADLGAWGAGGSDYMGVLAKLNLDGSLVWYKMSSQNSALKTTATPAYNSLAWDGSYLYWLGHRTGFTAWGCSLYKYDTNGNLIDSRIYGTNGVGIAGNTIINTTDHIIITGLDDSYKYKIHKISKADLDSETTANPTTTGMKYYQGVAGTYTDGTYLYTAVNSSSDGSTYDANTIYKTAISNLASTAKATSSTRLYTPAYIKADVAISTRFLCRTGGDNKITSILCSDLSEEWNTTPAESQVFSYFNGSFYAFYNSATDIVKVDKILDQNSYSASTVATIQSQASAPLTLWRVRGNIMVGSIDGKMLADSTDAGGTDCVLVDGVL